MLMMFVKMGLTLGGWIRAYGLAGAGNDERYARTLITDLRRPMIEW
jgi:hypothetical protein